MSAAESETALPARETPKVSVIIPAYNTAPFIAETLDSVFSQTFRNFEVIVINDGAPDTAELEIALQPYLSRVRYLKQENRGLSGARNDIAFRLRRSNGQGNRNNEQTEDRRHVISLRQSRKIPLKV